MATDSTDRLPVVRWIGMADGDGWTLGLSYDDPRTREITVDEAEALAAEGAVVMIADGTAHPGPTTTTETPRELEARLATASDPIISTAERLGTMHGADAALWWAHLTFDAALRTLRGIEDDDPDVMDSLPYPDLSGEWADEPTGDRVYEDIYADAGEEPPADRDDIGDVLDAYEVAWRDAAMEHIERACMDIIAELGDG